MSPHTYPLPHRSVHIATQLFFIGLLIFLSFTCLGTIYTSTHPLIHLSISPPTHSSIYLPTHPPIHPSIHSSIYLSAHPPTHPSIYQPTHPFNPQPIHSPSQANYVTQKVGWNKWKNPNAEVTALIQQSL